MRLDLGADRASLDETIGKLRPRLLVLDPFVRLHRIDENASGEVAPLSPNSASSGTAAGARWRSGIKRSHQVEHAAWRTPPVQEPGDDDIRVDDEADEAQPRRLARSRRTARTSAAISSSVKRSRSARFADSRTRSSAAVAAAWISASWRRRS